MPLRDSVERWSGVRLWVYRASSGPAPCAVMVRRQTGRLQRDVMISRSQIPMTPGSRASMEPVYALSAGLVACFGEGVLEVVQDVIAANASSRFPLGGDGGTGAS